MLFTDRGVIPLMKSADQIFSVRLDNGAKLSVGSYINLIIPEAGKLVNVSKHSGLRAKHQGLLPTTWLPWQEGFNERGERETAWLGLLAPRGGKTEIYPISGSELVLPETQQSEFSMFYQEIFNKIKNLLQPRSGQNGLKKKQTNLNRQ